MKDCKNIYIELSVKFLRCLLVLRLLVTLILCIDKVPEKTAQYWYVKFKNGNFDLKDATIEDITKEVSKMLFLYLTFHFNKLKINGN